MYLTEMEETSTNDRLSMEVEDIIDVIIAKIILCRKKRKITQKQLSIISGVPEVTIARMESFNRDYRPPRIDTILRLGIVLGIDLQFDYNPVNEARSYCYLHNIDLESQKRKRKQEIN